MRRAGWAVALLLLSLVVGSAGRAPHPVATAAPWSGPAILPRVVAETLAEGDAVLLAPSASALMTGAASVRRFNPGVTSEPALVWVVTVHTYAQTDGITAGSVRTFSVISEVMDAVTGRVHDYCIGCDWITRSR